MSDVIKPPPPPEKTTVAFAAVPDWAIELTKSVKEGLSNVETKIDTLSANVDLLQDDGRDTKARLIRLEGWKENVDTRIQTHSVKVRGTSENDLKQDSAIATLIVKTTTIEENQAAAKKRDEALAQALAKNTGITERVETAMTAAAKHPAVIAFLLALVTFATGWLGRHMP